MANLEAQTIKLYAEIYRAKKLRVRLTEARVQAQDAIQLSRIIRQDVRVTREIRQMGRER